MMPFEESRKRVALSSFLLFVKEVIPVRARSGIWNDPCPKRKRKFEKESKDSKKIVVETELELVRDHAATHMLLQYWYACIEPHRNTSCDLCPSPAANWMQLRIQGMIFCGHAGNSPQIATPWQRSRDHTLYTWRRCNVHDSLYLS